VPSGFIRKPLRLVVLLKYRNVPCAAGVGLGLGPGDGDGLGVGMGVGVGLGVLALTPPQPARNAIISRPRTSTPQAETDLFIAYLHQGKGRLLLDRNAQVSSRLAD
jgi:hypothetical protein